MVELRFLEVKRIKITVLAQQFLLEPQLGFQGLQVVQLLFLTELNPWQ